MPCLLTFEINAIPMSEITGSVWGGFTRYHQSFKVHTWRKITQILWLSWNTVALGSDALYRDFGNRAKCWSRVSWSPRVWYFRANSDVQTNLHLDLQISQWNCASRHGYPACRWERSRCFIWYVMPKPLMFTPRQGIRLIDTSAFLTFSDYIPMHSSSEQNTIALYFRIDRGWEGAFSCGTSVRGSSESHLEVLGITMLVFNGLRVLEWRVARW